MAVLEQHEDAVQYIEEGEIQDRTTVYPLSSSDGMGVGTGSKEIVMQDIADCAEGFEKRLKRLDVPFDVEEVNIPFTETQNGRKLEYEIDLGDEVQKIHLYVGEEVGDTTAAVPPEAEEYDVLMWRPGPSVTTDIREKALEHALKGFAGYERVTSDRKDEHIIHMEPDEIRAYLSGERF
jgi:hypothetical protein